MGKKKWADSLFILLLFLSLFIIGTLSLYIQGHPGSFLSRFCVVFDEVMQAILNLTQSFHSDVATPIELNHNYTKPSNGI